MNWLKAYRSIVVASLFLCVAFGADDWTHGTKRLLYIRVAYSDDTNEPISMEEAQTLLEQVGGFFQTNSFGDMTLESVVTSVVRMPRPKSAYFHQNPGGEWSWNVIEFMADARGAALREGYNTAEFDLDAVRFASPLWQSWALIGEKGAWFVNSSPSTTAHELGHNLGLQHANRWQGDLNGDGLNIEYGNPYDMMGNTASLRDGHFSAFEKHELGWLTDENVTHVIQSGVYRIYAHDVPRREAGRAYALRIKKDVGCDYWVEKRNLFEDREYLHTGVLIYWSPWKGSNQGTQLLDASADLGEQLPVGKTLQDAAAGVQITPLRQAPDGAWMDVAVLIGSANVPSGGIQLLEGPDSSVWAWSATRSGAAMRIVKTTDFRSWQEVVRTETDNVFVPLELTGDRAFYRALCE